MEATSDGADITASDAADDTAAAGADTQAESAALTVAAPAGTPPKGTVPEVPATQSCVVAA